MSTDFYDLPPEERGNWYERIREETGQDVHDLPPEERAEWYERAAREGYRGE